MGQINSDLINHTCNFVSIVDILMLRRVTKMALNIPICRMFRSRLIMRIQEICNVDKQLAKQLITTCNLHEGVISGSIILQVLIGEKWNSDIDIFVHNTRRFSKLDFIHNISIFPRSIR